MKVFDDLEQAFKDSWKARALVAERKIAKLLNIIERMKVQFESLQQHNLQLASEVDKLQDKVRMLESSKKSNDPWRDDAFGGGYPFGKDKWYMNKQGGIDRKTCSACSGTGIMGGPGSYYDDLTKGKPCSYCKGSGWLYADTSVPKYITKYDG